MRRSPAAWPQRGRPWTRLRALVMRRGLSVTPPCAGVEAEAGAPLFLHMTRPSDLPRAAWNPLSLPWELPFP